MNKIAKLGLSALCGSLAATAVNAGSLDVTGSAAATWMSKSGNTTTGNPLGMQSNLSFKGSGELDGGQTFSVTIAHADQDAYSSSNITLNTNSLGSFKISQAEGGQGIGGYDDKMPTAWEESWDTGNGAGFDQAKGVGSSTNVSWTSPSFSGSTLQIALAPTNNGTQVNDKSVSGADGLKGQGLDIVLDANPEISDSFGANFFVGYSVSELGSGAVDAGEKKQSGDHEEGVGGLILTIGPVKVGAQASVEHLARQTPTAVNGYINTSWGVSFNVNDNLSLSYGKFESKKGFVSKRENPTIHSNSSSFQIAYTMGGASIKIADTKVNGANYTSTSINDIDSTTMQLSLAF